MKPVVNRRSSGVGNWFRSGLIFLSYFTFFTFADLTSTLKKYESLLSPDLRAYWIWLVIYVLQFAFVVYQLVNQCARTNSLVNRKVFYPFVLHQVLFACWLKTFEAEMMVAATLSFVGVWITTFISYVLITSEFRNGDFVGYDFSTWLLIEVPFALTLGWDTFTLFTQCNNFVIYLTHETGFVNPTVELSAFIVSLCLIVQISVLFAGLSILMNPFLQIGLIWGNVFVYLKHDYKILFTRLNADQHEAMIPAAASLSAAFVAGLSAVYFVVSMVIILQSKFCLPEAEANLDYQHQLDMVERGQAIVDHQHRAAAAAAVVAGAQQRIKTTPTPLPPHSSKSLELSRSFRN